MDVPENGGVRLATWRTPESPSPRGGLGLSGGINSTWPSGIAGHAGSGFDLHPAVVWMRAAESSHARVAGGVVDPSVGIGWG